MISIGIDVSKGKSTVCFLRHDGEILQRPFVVIHTEPELSLLSSIIQSFKEECRVVMEATGHYHLPILNILQKAGLFICVVNPLLMKKYSLQFLHRGKTDSLDAIAIAEYGIASWSRLSKYVPENELYHELKMLNRQYHVYIQLRVNAKQCLTNLLDHTMPGIKTLLRMRSDVPEKEKLCAFALKYWHFDNITRMSVSKFTESYVRWAEKNGFRKSLQKALDIYALASFGGCFCYVFFSS